MRSVMAHLEKYVRKENCYLRDKDLQTTEITKRMWEKIGDKYLIYKLGGHKCNTQMSWKRLYNKNDKSKYVDPRIYQIKPTIVLTQ